jgi:hypothetical protein
VPAWQVANVLAYHLLGLALMSQVRLAALRQDWLVRKTGVSHELGSAWWRYSLAFIGLAALAALLLPTGYTAGLLDVLRYGTAVVLRAAYTIVATLLVLVSTPFWLLARWIMGGEVAAPQAPPLPGVRPPAPDPAGSGPEWLHLARAAFFWAAILAFAAYLVRGFVREHPEIREALASFRPLRWLARFWKAWWARLAGWRATVQARLRRTAGQADDARGSRRSALAQVAAPDGNRERVLYYYMELVRRAGRAGYRRKPAQTPLAYGATLKRELPERGQEVDVLTGAFVEARYSRHTIGKGIVERAKASWQQIRDWLRRHT